MHVEDLDCYFSQHVMYLRRSFPYFDQTDTIKQRLILF